MDARPDIAEGLSAVIGDLWLSDRVLADITLLCDQYGHRFAGSRSEALAREFIVEKFRAYGLENIAVEPCRYTAWRRDGRTGPTHRHRHGCTCVTRTW